MTLVINDSTFKLTISLPNKLILIEHYANIPSNLNYVVIIFKVLASNIHYFET